VTSLSKTTQEVVETRTSSSLLSELLLFRNKSVGYLRVTVSVYIPNPLCCYTCQQFCHGKNAYRGRETQAKCGQAGHKSDHCTNQTKCANCSGDHTAFSKDCPKWLFEKGPTGAKKAFRSSRPRGSSVTLTWI